MTSSANIIRHVIVRGRVQGVGYRAFVEHAASRRGLENWVRNRRDGSVEAVFAGHAEEVAQIVAECRRGPSASRVEGVEETPGTDDMLRLRPAGERFAVLLTV